MRCRLDPLWILLKKATVTQAQIRKNRRKRITMRARKQAELPESIIKTRVKPPMLQLWTLFLVIKVGVGWNEKVFYGFTTMTKRLQKWKAFNQ